jgi:outer membrane lipoprotein carrier protein
MRRYILTLLVSLMSLAASAQSEQQIIDKINNNSAKIKTLSCDFVQTKQMKMLNNKFVSKGKMYYEQPNKLRWEYTTPYSYTFLMNDSKVLIKNNNRSDIIDINQNKMFKEIARLMMNSIVGESLNNRRTFDVAIVSNEKQYVATLTPLEREMKQMWSKIMLYFDKVTLGVVKVEMVERTGDKTTIELKNIVVNGTIKPGVFAIN